MRKGFTIQQALGVPLLAAGIWGSAAMVSRAESPRTGAACAVWINDAIPLNFDSTSVVINYSEPIGQTLSASMPDDSKITVLGVARGGNPPQSATLAVNTRRAVAGQWELTLRGDTGTCTGKVWVGKGTPKKK
jgi:hypothetical protein